MNPPKISSFLKPQTSAVALAIALSSSAVATDRPEFPEEELQTHTVNPTVSLQVEEDAKIQELTQAILEGVRNTPYPSMIENAIATIAKEDRIDVLSRVLENIIDSTKGSASATYIKAIGGVAMNERNHFMEMAKPHLQGKIDHAGRPLDGARSCTLRLLSLIPSDQWDEETFRETASLIIPSLSNSPNYSIVGDIEALPKEEVVEFIKMILRILGKIPGTEPDKIAQALRTIERDSRAGVIEETLSFFNNRFNARNFDLFLKTIGKIKNDCRDVLERAEPLTSQLKDPYICTKIIEIIGGIEKNDRPDVVEKAQHYTKNLTEGYVLARNLELVSLMHPDQRTDENCRLVTTLLEVNENAHGFISSIEGLGKEDLIDVIRKVHILAKDKTNEHFLGQIIKTLSRMVRDERDAFIDMVLPLIEPFDDYGRMLIIQSIASIEKADREEVIKKSLPYFDSIEKGWTWSQLLKFVSLIPSDQRDEENVREVFDFLKFIIGINKGTAVTETVNALETVAREDLIDVLQKAPLLLEAVKDLGGYGRSTHRQTFIKILEFVPKDHRPRAVELLLTLKETDNIKFFYKSDNFNNCLSFLMQHDEELKESIITKWSSLLSSEDEKVAKEISDFVTQNAEQFGLYEEHPLVQEAIRVGTLLTNTDDPLNPYNFHKKLKLLREEVVEIDPTSLPSEVFEGVRVSLNPSYLKTLPQVTITFKDLPKYSKDFLKTMKAQIDGRLDDQLKIDDYQSLIQGSLGSDYLQSLLNLQGKPDDVVPFVASKLIATVAHLETLDNTCSPDAFSEREEKFLMMLSSIQSCATGKDGGIDDSYDRLPQHAKYQAVSDSKTHAFLENIIRSEVEKMFSGENRFFKDLTGGAPDEEVKQAIHQARYVEGGIGKDVGSSRPLTFDSHTQTLNMRLVALSKEEFLKTFYKHFPPHVLVDATLGAINKGLQVPKNTLFTNLQALMDNNALAKAWGFDGSYNPFMTEFGAAHLLLKLGALNEVK